jgi:hypothetical protein
MAKLPIIILAPRKKLPGLCESKKMFESAGGHLNFVSSWEREGSWFINAVIVAQAKIEVIVGAPHVGGAI